MPLFDSTDLDALADDLGTIDVTIGATTVSGFLDHTDVEVLPGNGAPQYAERIVVKVRTGALPGLEVGAAITVDGDDYTVSLVRRIQDGAFTEILLDTA